MSMQYRLPDHVVQADPWTFYCAVCSETMRIKTLAPSQGGMKTRTYRCSYECACGHRETFDVVPSLTGSRLSGGFPSFQHVSDAAGLEIRRRVEQDLDGVAGRK